jgi:hypothetical protein
MENQKMYTVFVGLVPMAWPFSSTYFPHCFHYLGEAKKLADDAKNWGGRQIVVKDKQGNVKYET